MVEGVYEGKWQKAKFLFMKGTRKYCVEWDNDGMFGSLTKEKIRIPKEEVIEN